MNDHDVSPPSDMRARRAARQSTSTALDSSLASSSSSAVPPESTTLNDAVEYPRQRVSVSGKDNAPYDDNRRHSKEAGTRGHRSHKHRSSGAFLLSDPVFDDASHDAGRTYPNKRNRDSVEYARALSHTPDKMQARGTHAGGSQSLTPDSAQRTSTASSSPQTKRDSLAGDTAVGSSPKGSMAPLDVDAAQIVNMALNLSESRRLASRRNASTPVPPRLVPLPDSTTGGSLRQHLQQQRRVSRTISPRPDRSPRLASGQRVLSPLQSAFEHDGTYRYHFSQSTLARAQKAKEYLELMSQYRRVLDLVPPLKPARGSTARSSTASPPRTPGDSAQTLSRYPSTEPDTKIGRPYNPLQYIRNRKVRARERKVIDGEAQGFGEVIKASEWVDEVAKWVATGQHRVPGNPGLPPFTPAHETATIQSSPPAASSSRPVITVSKPKRPRVDWVIDPAEMIADVYWLEQDDNKKMVEDRHWRRVFPQDQGLFRPLSQDSTGPQTGTPRRSTKEFADTQLPTEGSPAPPPELGELKQAKSEPGPGHSLSSARDRAQQKLRALKGAHRHNGSVHKTELLRIHRGSMSESSDTDSDRRQRARNAIIGSNEKDVLEKQMRDMLAREQREAESRPPYDPETLRLKLTAQGLMTPDGEKGGRTTPLLSRASSCHRRAQSHADVSETDNNNSNKYFSKMKPLPQGIGMARTSLEVPGSGRRFSVDYDTSQPNSPDLRPLRDPGSQLVPAIGMDLSPTSSRPSSPTRNPFTKVKSIFRERSRERAAESHAPERPERDDSAEASVAAPPSERLLDSPATDKSAAGMQSPPRRPSKSPVRKVLTRGTDSSHKSHKSASSVKIRGDDATGLRGLFRGPRIDSVLRSGVSKVSDMLWRSRDAAVTAEDSDTSSDESDKEELTRGRSRTGSRRGHQDLLTPSISGEGGGGGGGGGKRYLDVMPHFTHTTDHHGHHHRKSASVSELSPSSLAVPGENPSRPPSRRSSRFDLLKPPKIDVQNASPPGSSPPPLEVHRLREHGVGVGVGAEDDPDRKGGGGFEGVRAADARLNAVLSSFNKTRQFSITTGTNTTRHWSISAAGVPPATLSKREVARLRALLLSSGIQAMEMDRRAKERKLRTSTSPPNTKEEGEEEEIGRFAWEEVARLAPDPQDRRVMLTRPLMQTDVYPLAAQVLRGSLQRSAQRWRETTDKFSTVAAPQLEQRAEGLRMKVAGELTDRTRQAAEEADEANHDLATGQRLKVKRVVDTIEKMLRRRRRRFRWVRRAGWLAVEWALVGFMCIPDNLNGNGGCLLGVKSVC
ncbi:hypothetical protein QBC46DRAFT_409709 [Diplogelasinospora grovesii]|uniref:Uncharacterized protein n=1 Tax=Diplogelasinospora grovesii TaxID=303347 RepID=A0AAN6N483_9PEZI|nr:hypothetical protein QBC46DRAFT_409709 [Diplogelasinospora grovesii]